MQMVDLDRCTAVFGKSYNYADPNDPVRQIIEERSGKIMKVFEVYDGLFVTLCDTNEKEA